MPSQRETEQTLREQEQPIEEAFLLAVATVLAGAVLARLSEKMLPGIIDALSYERRDLSRMVEAVRAAYVAGAFLEDEETGVPFDMAQPDVLRWLDESTEALVGRINEQQAEAIRVIYTYGINHDRDMEDIIRDIVGRKTRGGKRVGGVLGLNDQQAQWLINAREELASGDPPRMNNYLNRKLRDRGFDKIVKRAIRKGKTLDQRTIDRIIAQYAHNLLKSRAQVIAQTEAHQSFERARLEAWNQAIASGEVEDASKSWITERDERVRLKHRAMLGQTVSVRELFTGPEGSQLDYPGDATHGAPAGMIVNCRCTAVYSAA